MHLLREWIMTTPLDWKCAGCGAPSPDRFRSCRCPTNCVTIGHGKKSAWKIEPEPHRLAETIRSRLLGIKPEDQDVVLEDSDWKLILAGLNFIACPREPYRNCQRCGSPTYGEEAQIEDQYWCHPCADEFALTTPK
jgi:hypothetical protein